MDTMQAEALRRVQEMQNSAHRGPRQTPLPKADPPRNNNSHRESSSVAERSRQGTDEPPASAINTGENPTLSTLFEDKEKLLILVLILILNAEESADISLTLALLYLII